MEFITEISIAEAVRMSEIYGSIRRYAGLHSSFAPYPGEPTKKELLELKGNLKLWFETVPEDIRDMHTLNTQYSKSLDVECDRRINDLEKREKNVTEKVMFP